MSAYIAWFLQAALPALLLLVIAFSVFLLMRSIRRRCGKSVTPLSPSKLILDLLIAGDILVTLILTLVTYRDAEHLSLQLIPFFSWRQAWHSWSASLFEQLFLNIAVFLPFGLLTAIRFPALRRIWRMALTAFSFSLVIEVTQLILRRGVFDVDDLFCNTLGGLLGGTLISFICALRQNRPRTAICASLPWLASGLACAMLFGAYAAQPYGNLEVSAIPRHTMRNVAVTVAEGVADTPSPATAAVYAARSYTPDEAEAFARSIFTAIGADMVHFRADHYNSESWITNSLGLMCQFNRLDGSFTLSHTANGKHPAPEDPTEAELRTWLTSFGFDIPADTAAATVDEDTVVWQIGHFCCTLRPDGRWTIQAEPNELRAVAEVPILSADEAIDAIRSGTGLGRFDFSALEITSLALTQRTDSKGFLVPVWQVKLLMDGTQRVTVIIPAMR